MAARKNRTRSEIVKRDLSLPGVTGTGDWFWGLGEVESLFGGRVGGVGVWGVVVSID